MLVDSFRWTELTISVEELLKIFWLGLVDSITVFSIISDIIPVTMVLEETYEGNLLMS